MFAIAAASLASTVASTFIGMKGAGDEASGIAQANNYQAQVAQNNATVAEQNAQRALIVGDRDAETQNYKTRALVGQQKAGQAASGVDVNSGSALDVRTSSIELGHLDALTLLNNAGAKAAGYRAQKTNFEAEAGLDTLKANNALTAGKDKQLATLIGGVSSFSDKWLGFQQKGLLS